MVYDYINNWDAIVVTCLRGMAGEGIADVVFGDG